MCERDGETIIDEDRGDTRNWSYRASREISARIYCLIYIGRHVGDSICGTEFTKWPTTAKRTTPPDLVKIYISLHARFRMR